MVYVKKHKPLVLFCIDRHCLNYSIQCLRPVRLLEIQGIVLTDWTHSWACLGLILLGLQPWLSVIHHTVLVTVLLKLLFCSAPQEAKHYKRHTDPVQAIPQLELWDIWQVLLSTRGQCVSSVLLASSLTVWKQGEECATGNLYHCRSVHWLDRSS